MRATVTPKELRDRRIELGVSLDDVCVALGAPGNASELVRWEKGQRVSLPHGASVKDYERVLDDAEKRARKSA